MPYGILLVIALVWSAMLVHDVLYDPIGLFSSTTNLFLMVVWPLLALLFIVEIVAYLRWRSRAKKAAACGEFIDTPNTRRFQRIVYCVCMLAFAVEMLYNVTAGSSMLRVTSIAMVLYVFVLMVVVQGVKQLLKRKKVFAQGQPSGYADSGCGARVWHDGRHRFWHATRNPKRLAGHQDRRRSIAADAGRIVEKRIARGGLSLRLDGNRRLAAGRRVRCQRAGLHKRCGWFIPSLDYTVTEVKLPALYGRCRAQLLEKEISLNWRQVSFSTKRIATPCDAAPWGANEAWQVAWENEIPSDDYLLCYDRNLVEISFSWTPTDEQKALVGEKLGDL